MKYKLLMAFALLTLLFMGGCQKNEYSIDFSKYEKGTRVIIIGYEQETKVINECAEQKGELTIKNKLFGTEYICTVPLTKE